MYSFDPSEEQQMLIEVARRYAENELRGAARAGEVGAGLDPAIVQTGWDLGVLQASVPEEYGGYGEHETLTGVLAGEELARGDLAGALAVMSPGLFAFPILKCGSEGQKSAWLPKVLDDPFVAYTAALIEPRFDFDPCDLTTTAAVEGDSYVLKGSKRFVPYADRAEAFLVYASLDGQTQGFIVEKGAAGLTVGEQEKGLGINGLPSFRVELDGLKVAKDARLGGPEGHDFKPILTAARIALSALATGLAQAAFEYSRDYAKEREVLGSKIAQKQSIAFMVAEMATEIEATRLLTWEAAWLFDRGQVEAAEKAAFLAVNGAADVAMMVTDRAVQILGGHGYICDHPVELWMRNGRGISALTGLAMV